MLSQPGGLCFSRAEPRHKQDIVRLLKEMGEVTAMTGACQFLGGVSRDGDANRRNVLMPAANAGSIDALHLLLLSV